MPLKIGAATPSRFVSPWCAASVRAVSSVQICASLASIQAFSSKGSCWPRHDPVPEVKPFFRDIFVGDDGRVWVFRYVAAQKRTDAEPLPDRPERPLLTWREPWTFDVFEPDGTFLGSVEVPELLEPLGFRGDRIWGTLMDADGVEHVVRLRVVPEDGS